jgi:hypothetical protein
LKTGKDSPSGMSMMLKALGIEIDPDMIAKMGQAVGEIRERLERIETKLDRALSIFPKDTIGQQLRELELPVQKEAQNGDGR